MLNRVVIQGRIEKDIELRHTQSGVSVVSFSIAVDRDFKDKATGEKTTDWVCQRRFEIVRKRRRNFVIFRRGG